MTRTCALIAVTVSLCPPWRGTVRKPPIMSLLSRRSYVGAPRVYLTHGVHEDGEWKRMWYVADTYPGHHFLTWREAIDYALSVPVPAWATDYALSVPVPAPQDYWLGRR